MTAEKQYGDSPPKSKTISFAGLTDKQAELLAFIEKSYAENCVTPSYEEMMLEMGLRSKSGIHRIIVALEDRGKIRRRAACARSIEVIRQENVSTRRALEVVLSRCKLNKEAEASLRYLLSFECWKEGSE